MTLKKNVTEFVITLEKSGAAAPTPKKHCVASATRMPLRRWRIGGEREKKMVESEKEKEVRKAVKLG